MVADRVHLWYAVRAMHSSIWAVGLAVTGLLICRISARGGNLPEPPPTPRLPVTNFYHGVAVVDDYQWLEKGEAPEVRAWCEAQNRRTRACLDAIPECADIEKRLRELAAPAGLVSPSYSRLHWRQGRLFALKYQPPAPQPMLVTLDSLQDLSTERVLLDLGRLHAEGRASLDFYLPSPDGKRVAVCLSENGSEQGTLFFYDTATGERLPDKLERVQFPTGGGSVAWAADSQGVFYTRYPAPGERPAADLWFYQQVYYHALGAAQTEDRYEIGREFPRIAGIDLESSPDGRRLLASVGNGDGGEIVHYLRSPEGVWRQITRFEDQVKQARFGRDPLYIEWGRDEAVYLLSFRHAPRGRVLRLDLNAGSLTEAVEVIPQGAQALTGVLPAASGLYLHYRDGGPSLLQWHDFFTGKTIKLPLRPSLRGQPPANSSIAAVQEMLVVRGDELLYRTVTYLDPPGWFQFDPNVSASQARGTALQEPNPVDFSDVEVVRVNVKSTGNTEVPLNIIRAKGARTNGNNPVILSGYGGYGISLAPSFDPTRRLWLDLGGIFAIANLRGGGEFGEDWHQAGALTNKQNVFDDFLACAAWLFTNRVTCPERLAIRGGSNGGLLMGAALTQRPDWFGAVVAQVGVFDMLRVELDPNGEFNTTEFGTVKDPAQFRALHAYSPYHQVREQTLYPPTLLLTGDKDGRVNPSHSRKMAARLQAAGARGPTLLQVNFSGGHGIGATFGDRLAELSMIYAFIAQQLNAPFPLVDRGPWAGAVTTNAAVVKAKLIFSDLAARLAVSREPSLADPVWFGPERSGAGRHNLVAFNLGGLQPDTLYHYALEVNGRLERSRQGQFRTFPHGPASFTIAWGTCAKTGSNSEVFDRIREHQPLLFINAGDFHYLDIGENKPARFRAAYDRVLASPAQAALYRSTAFAYVWDDHDSGGNNCNKTAKSHPAARQVYQEYVPHYPLGLGGGNQPIAQSFAIGRVKFILTDLRSERDPVSDKTEPQCSLMGRAQKEWFKRELLAAKGRYPLICWVGSVGWVGTKGTNFYPLPHTNVTGVLHHTNLIAAALEAAAKGRKYPSPGDQENWLAFPTERREIADFIKANQIRGVCYLHGDAHSLSADDGRNGDYATGGGAPIPSMGAAPLDQNPSIKGGPFSQGVYRPRPPEGCFGLLHIHDRGETIEVTFSGRNSRDEEKIALKFSVPAALDPAP